MKNRGATGAVALSPTAAGAAADCSHLQAPTTNAGAASRRQAVATPLAHQAHLQARAVRLQLLHRAAAEGVAGGNHDSDAVLQQPVGHLQWGRKERAGGRAQHRAGQEGCVPVRLCVQAKFAFRSAAEVPGTWRPQLAARSMPTSGLHPFCPHLCQVCGLAHAVDPHKHNVVGATLGLHSTTPRVA